MLNAIARDHQPRWKITARFYWAALAIATPEHGSKRGPGIRPARIETPTLSVYQHDGAPSWRTLAHVPIEGAAFPNEWSPTSGSIVIKMPGILGTNSYAGRLVDVIGVLRPSKELVVEGMFGYPAYHTCKQNQLSRSALSSTMPRLSNTMANLAKLKMALALLITAKQQAAYVTAHHSTVGSLIEAVDAWRNQVTGAIEPSEDRNFVRSWLNVSRQCTKPRALHDLQFQLAMGASLKWIDEALGVFATQITQMEQSPQQRQISRDKRIFIGHGRSPLWRELKDFLVDNLGLKHEEFNRESAAGIHTVERLEQMMSNSCFAFLIMTAEDEVADGKMRARENVVHEAGLFHGRLGFRRAIILRESSCGEFSNAFGLTQILFPPGNIMAESEKIRDVLKRENIII